ncbi:GAD-like domain-containing protein [uncultured Paracoccus sp.]|uniref:GAD-like domain-containing protein n=1 Tax=Paracoccus sp. S1E-3 TaxID=2756130 RepID=UPI0015EE5EFE|nr:GAD-like domain-containing protein [uncultured Paracoccus sp.]MBA4490651.1 hypothetical protein [Paracoccus sp. S1E-3]
MLQLEAMLSAASDHRRPAPADAVARWSGRLPPLLLDIWRRYGLVRLAGGRLRLVDPRRFEPLMGYVFHGDPDLAGDTHVIGLGDLGELALWSERHGFGFLSPLTAALEMPYIIAPDAPSADTQIADLLIAIPASAIEAFDHQHQPLHDRLHQKLGRLDHDEIYAATPVPPRLGGTPIEDYEIADGPEWLEAVYAVMNVTLVDYQRDPFELRMVGSAWPAGMAATRKRMSP